MKKIVAVLCALALILGSLSGWGNTETVKAGADGKFPATVTVAGWSDPAIYDDAEDYASIEVSNGTDTVTDIGGASYWSYGYILAEPDQGYELKRISYMPNGEIIDISDKIKYLSDFIDELSNIPTAVSGDLESHRAQADNIKGIFIDRAFYEDICYIQGNAPVYLEFVNSQDEEQTYEYTVNFQYDTRQSSTEIQTGKTIDVIGYWKEQVNGGHDLMDDGVNTFSINDYEINEYSINFARPFSDALERIQNTACSYLAKSSGSFSVELCNNVTGLTYELFIDVVYADIPIKIEDIDVGDLEILPGTNFGESTLMYGIQPREGDGYYVRKVNVSFELPQAASGCAIAWDKSGFYGQYFSEGQTLYTGSGSTSLSGSMVGNRAVFELESQKEIQNTQFEVCITFNENDYNYTFTIRSRPRFPHTGFHGYGHFPVRPFERKPLSDYLHIEDTAAEEREMLYSMLESGDLYFDTDAIIPEIKNGKFTGYLIFTAPVSHMSFVEKDTGYNILSDDLNIYFKTGTVITSGTGLNLTELLNGYDGGLCVKEVLKRSGNSWEADPGRITEDNIFIAPSVTEKAEYIVRYKDENIGFDNHYEAVVNITVVPDTAYEEAVCEEIGLLEDNGTLTLYEDLSKTSISADVLKAVKESGTGAQLVIENSDKANKIEWIFSQELLDGDDSDFKDIDLSTVVGVGNETLEDILESNSIEAVPISFADNGQLPGTVTVRLYLTDEQAGKITDKDNVQLYYQDGDDLKLYSSGLQLIYDRSRDSYFVEIKVDHNSTFCISSAKGTGYSKPEEVRPVLESISIVTPPSKTVYTEGEVFEPSGMIVNAVFNDGTKKAITDYTYTPDEKLNVSDTTVTISYTLNGVTKTITQAISVNKADASSSDTGGSNTGGGSGTGGGTTTGGGSGTGGGTTTGGGSSTGGGTTTGGGSGTGGGTTTGGGSGTGGGTTAGGGSTTGSETNTGGNSGTDAEATKADQVTGNDPSAEEGAFSEEAGSGVIKNTDGSETETKKIKNPDGSTTTTVVTTQKDGAITKTETTVNADGSSISTEESKTADGTVITKEETTDKKGNKTIVENISNPDGTTVQIQAVQKTNGKESATITTKDADGNVLSITEENTTVSKKGTITFVSSTLNADGSSVNTKVKTYAGGKEVSETVENNADGSSVKTKSTTTTDPAGVTKVEIKATLKDVDGKVSGTVTTEKDISVLDAKGNTTINSETVEKDAKGNILSTTSETIVVDKKGKASVTSVVTDAKGARIEEKYTVSTKGNIKMSSIKTKQKEMDIPDLINVNGTDLPVTSIGTKALKGNKKIRTISIGGNVATIGRQAFKGAKNLSTIILTDSVTGISADAFKDISEEAVFKIKASKKDFKRIVNLLGASGISNGVSFERIKEK